MYNIFYLLAFNEYNNIKFQEKKYIYIFRYYKMIFVKIFYLIKSKKNNKKGT